MTWEAISENPAGVNGSFIVGIKTGRLFKVVRFLSPFIRDLPCEDNANHCYAGCRQE